MQVYKLTNIERLLCDALSVTKTQTILVVCDVGGNVGCMVEYSALLDPLYADYLAILSPLDSERIVEYVSTGV